MAYVVIMMSVLYFLSFHSFLCTQNVCLIRLCVSRVINTVILGNVTLQYSLDYIVMQMLFGCLIYFSSIKES